MNPLISVIGTQLAGHVSGLAAEATGTVPRGGLHREDRCPRGPRATAAGTSSSAFPRASPRAGLAQPVGQARWPPAAVA
ncbi:MAG: hypothetical protein ACRDN0_11360 [Trebonia sp.]